MFRTTLITTAIVAAAFLATGCDFELEGNCSGAGCTPGQTEPGPSQPSDPNDPNWQDPATPPQGLAPDSGLAPDAGGSAPDPDSGTPPPPPPPPPPPATNPLLGVKYWAYQIQGLDQSGAVSKLVASKYDMLVLEPTNTDTSNAGFDGKGMVTKLHASTGKSGKKKIVIAYIDIGEAESWRYYWKSGWKAPTNSNKGNPDFLIIPDPDGWADNYPVAYWDSRWKDIMIYNSDSMLQKALDDGYDGIYMDWIEAYSNDAIKAEAQKQGKDPAVEMIKFIGEIRDHARKQNPKFLVIAQNSPELVDGHPEYFKKIDAIAQEQIYYDGDADVGWSSPDGCDKKVPNTGAGYSAAFYNGWLAKYKAAGLPVFNVEYACASSKVSTSYTKSQAQGHVTYVSRRSLEKLTSDTPPGY